MHDRITRDLSRLSENSTGANHQQLTHFIALRSDRIRLPMSETAMPASTFGRSISKRKLSILVAALMAICGVVTAIRFHATGQKRLTDAAAAPWTSVVQPMLGDSSSDAAWSQVQDWEILSNSSVLHRTCLTHQVTFVLSCRMRLARHQKIY